MNYKSMPLYQKINSINEGVKDNLKSIADFRKENLHQFKNPLHTGDPHRQGMRSPSISRSNL